MRICAAVLLVSGLGCANGAARSGRPTRATVGTRDSDVITSVELSDPAIIGADALEAVRRLRPRFLAKRGAVSIKMADAGTVHISIDGGPLLTPDYLAGLRSGDIAEIRYLNATDAAQRFGTVAGSGAVILIRSR